jgi:hypothetical protein
MKAPKLYDEMMQWLEDGSSTAPSQLDDPENLLADALDYEVGTYERDDDAQKDLAAAAIEAFCEQTDDYE